MRKTANIAKIGQGALVAAAPLVLGVALLVSGSVSAATTPPAGRCAGTIYVANTPDGTISVIDTSTDRVVATIAVGKGPAVPIFTRDGMRAYVNNTMDGTISELDVVNHQVVRTIRLPDGLTGSGFALSPRGDRAVLTKLGEPGFAVIVDLASGRASPAIPVGINSERVVITPDGKWAYVADGNPKGAGGTVTVLNLDAGRAVKTIPVGKFPFNLIAMPDGKTVYVANIFSASISVIDTASQAVVATIPTAAYPNGMALSPDRRSIYLTNFTIGSMQVLDLATRKVSAAVRTSANPSYLALSPGGRQAYYVHPLGNTVSVVDTATLGLASTIVVGKQPTALGACPFAGTRRTVAAAAAPRPVTANAATHRLSVETTSIGELLDNPAARAVLVKHVPEVVANPLIQQGRGMTLGNIRDMRADFISEEKVAAIDAELAKLPSR